MSNWHTNMRCVFQRDQMSPRNVDSFSNNCVKRTQNNVNNIDNIDNMSIV